MLPTLPDRLALARAQKLDYSAFLTLILADEVQKSRTVRPSSESKSRLRRCAGCQDAVPPPRRTPNRTVSNTAAAVVKSTGWRLSSSRGVLRGGRPVTDVAKDGWEQIRRSFRIQFEALADGRQLILHVEPGAGGTVQEFKEYWIADRVLPCASCGSFVVLDRNIVLVADSVTLTCENDHEWTVIAEEHGPGEPPVRGDAHGFTHPATQPSPGLG